MEEEALVSDDADFEPKPTEGPSTDGTGDLEDLLTNINVAASGGSIGSDSLEGSNKDETEDVPTDKVSLDDIGVEAAR